MARQSLEHDLQVTFFEILAVNERRWPFLRWVFAVPNQRASKAEAGRMKAEGVKAGVWDVFVCIPTRNAPGLWIEFKAGRNKLTAAQEAFQCHLSNYGFKRLVAYDLETALSALEDYLSIRLSK